MKIMNSGIEKMKSNVLQTVKIKEEGKKMIRKYLIVGVTLLTFLCNVLPAQAYTVLSTPVTVSATGTLTGSTVAFSAVAMDQATGLVASPIVFPAVVSTTAIPTNSGECLKITGGTNEVNARIIISTDNDTLFTNALQDPRKKDVGGVIQYSGSDGSGMIGVTDQGYVVPLVWGASDTPNSPGAYTFTATNWSYITDKWHNKSYVPTLSDGITVDPNYAVLDTAVMYRKLSNVAEPNTANEGTGDYKKLYPQFFGAVGADYDLYDLPSTNPARKVYTLTIGGVAVPVGQALYQNIATIAYSIQTAGNNYTCEVPKLSTPATDDSTLCLLKRTGAAGADGFIYINIGADFRGAPAQTYSTTQLYVAMVNG